MKNVLGTKTHLLGYLIGIVSAALGAAGPNVISSGDSKVALGGGLFVIAVTLAVKLLADLGVSKATIEADWNKAVKVLGEYDAIKPLLDELPGFKELAAQIASFEGNLSAKTVQWKSDLEGEILKIPAANRDFVLSVVQELFGSLKVPEPAPAPSEPAPAAEPVPAAPAA